MIQCSTYDEARFDLIHLLSTDSYIKSAEIIFDKENNMYYVNYDVFDYDEWDELP